MNAQLPRDLITIDRATAFATFTTDDPEQAFAPILAELRAIVAAWNSPGADTAEGRDAIKAFAFKITKSRTAVEAVGKELAAEAKATPKKIDASRRYIEAEIDAIRDAVRKPLTAWEVTEAERVTRIRARLSRLEFDRTVAASMSVVALKATISECEALDPASFDEFAAEIDIANRATLNVLRAALVNREKAEAEAAELAALRAEKARRDQEDREADIAASAAREAEKRIKAEADAREKKLREEKEAAEKAAADAKADAERAAIEAAAKAKADLEAQKRADAEDARKREANKAHKGKVNREALADLIEQSGVSEAIGKKIVGAIALGSIRHVAISY